MDEEQPRKTLSEIVADAEQAQGGITCPKCACRHVWKVRDTDRIEGAIRRYRVCRNCKHVIRTVEQPG